MADTTKPPVPDLEAIHATALRLLTETGIRTTHVGMRERLAGAGCRVAGERVLIPSEVVERTLAAIPPAFDLYGRSGQLATIGREAHTYFTNTGILPNIYDLDSGQIRRTTLADVQATTRLLDAMEHVDVVYVSLVDATDLPPHLVTLGDFAATLANTAKPLIGPGVTSRAEAEAVVAMARAVCGGDAGELRQHPLCVPFVCPVSPLSFPDDIVDALAVVAQAGLPLDVVSNPVMGLTAPYTIAGTVALGHAEVLATAVMAHAVQPGLPILNQDTPSVADMRTLASTTGGPETGLIRRTAMQLGRRLGIPGVAHGHTSSAALDYQAAAEKALNQLLIAAARPAILGGLGGMANVTLTAYESILLDDELYGAIRRALAGVATDEEHLDFAALTGIAEAGNAMGSEHTLRYLRSGEVWQPRLANRQGLVAGQASAGTSVERSRAEVRRVLASHEVAPLPAAVRAELDGILEAYDRGRGR